MRSMLILLAALTIVVVSAGQGVDDNPLLQNYKDERARWMEAYSSCAPDHHHDPYSTRNYKQYRARMMEADSSRAPDHHPKHYSTDISTPMSNRARSVVSSGQSLVDSVRSRVGSFGARARQIWRKNSRVVGFLSSAIIVMFTIQGLGSLYINNLNSPTCRDYASVDNFGEYSQMSEYELKAGNMLYSREYTLYDPNGDSIYKFDPSFWTYTWDVQEPSVIGSSPSSSSNEIHSGSDSTSSDLRSSSSSIGQLRRDLMPLFDINYRMTFSQQSDLNPIKFTIRYLDGKYVLTINGVEFIATESVLTRLFQWIPVSTFAQSTSSSGVNSSSGVPTHLGVVVGKASWWTPVYRLCLPSTDDPALDRQRLLALSTAAIGDRTERQIADAASSSSSSSSSNKKSAAPAPFSIPGVELAPAGSPSQSPPSSERSFGRKIGFGKI